MAHGTKEYLPLKVEEDPDDQDVITPNSSLSSLKKLSHSNLARISEHEETKAEDLLNDDDDEEEDDPYCIEDYDDDDDDDEQDVNDTLIILEEGEDEEEEAKESKSIIIIPSRVHKSQTMADHFPNLHEPAFKSQRSKLKKYVTVRTNKPDLTEQECELLEEQIDILLDKDIQKLVLNELLELYPKLQYSFSMVSGEEAQAAFVCKMVRKGYIHCYNHNYDEIYNIFTRHPKYGIKKEYITSSFGIILKCVLKHKSITKSLDSSLMNRSKIVWTKSNEIMNDLMIKAFKFDYNNKLRKKPNAKILKQNRNRINRSMSDQDIDTVVNIWTKMLADNKEKVADLLAIKLQKQTEIYIQFQKFNIDIFKQSAILINMLDKTINELTHTDALIPFLKKLGARHHKMGIKPQLLATMKKVILELIKDILSFNFNDQIKEAWNKVLTFIVGMMVAEYSNSRLRKGSELSTTTSSTDRALMTKPTLYDQYDSNDIDMLETQLTQTVIINCQITWKYISQDSIINNAVKIFYNDLLQTKQEIRDLFSKSNMAEQSMRLVRAIGSTVALLDDLDTLIPILQELGKRHVYYGVKPEHFKYVKKCWFKMLRKALMMQWNKQVNNSWQIAWDFMTYHMKSSLEDALLLYVPPEPIMVNFKVLINHIDRVKLQDLSFFGDIWFAAYTGDNSSQSYAFGHGAINNANSTANMDGGGVLPFGGLRCLNAMQTTDKYRGLKEPYIRYFEEDESWYLRGNIVGTFSQLFELHAYPFDCHNIEITFALEVDDTIARFNEDRMSVRLMPFKLESMAGTNYNVHEPQIQLSEMSAVKGGSTSGRRYTHCKITIPISRKYIHHVYNVIIPLMAIQLIAFAIYFTDLFPISARLILSMTLFLTLFAFRRSVSGSLPPTPYLTILDHAFNAACLLSVYHVAGLCAINQFQHLPDEICQFINLIIAIVGVVIFLIIHIYLYIRARHYISLYPKTSPYEDSGVTALKSVAKSALGKSAMGLDDSTFSLNSPRSSFSKAKSY